MNFGLACWVAIQFIQTYNTHTYDVSVRVKETARDREKKSDACRECTFFFFVLSRSLPPVPVLFYFIFYAILLCVQRIFFYILYAVFFSPFSLSLPFPASVSLQVFFYSSSCCLCVCVSLLHVYITAMCAELNMITAFKQLQFYTKLVTTASVTTKIAATANYSLVRISQLFLQTNITLHIYISIDLETSESVSIWFFSFFLLFVITAMIVFAVDFILFLFNFFFFNFFSPYMPMMICAYFAINEQQ